MNENCGCNQPEIMILACKVPVKKVFDSPKPLSPGDRAKSTQLGGKCC